MEHLSIILDRNGFGLVTQPRNENSFYYIMNSIKYQTRNPSCKIKKEITDFEIKNGFYFHIFLTQCIDCDGTIPPEDCLARDFKQSDIEKRSPSPREIFATSEFLQRFICLYRIGHSVNSIDDFEGFIFSPVMRNCLSPEPICIVMNERKDGYPEFALIDFRDHKKKIDFCPGNLVNRDHVDCFGLRFSNRYEFLYNLPCYGLQEDVADLFERFSLELYGTQGHHLRIINAVCDLELKEDYIDLFYKYIANPSEEEIKYSEKERLLRIHVEKIRSKSTKPGRGELFALSSVFNVDIYIGKRGRIDWELYMPITSAFAKIFHSPILLILQQKDSADFRPYISPGHENECSCCQDRPSIHGKIGMLANNIYERPIKIPCCGIVGRHGFHKHLAHIPNSRTIWPDRTDCFAPDEAKQTACFRILTEKRQIDEINGGSGTLKDALAKELFENESSCLSIIKDLDEAHDVEENIKKVCDVINLPIYVLNMKFVGSSLSFYWKQFEPSDQKRTNKYCRFYITLFCNHSNQTIDRIIPLSGCNCILPPPLSLLQGGEDGNSGVKLYIQKNDRHRVFERYFRELVNILYRDEARDFPPCSPYSGLRTILKRQDMKERTIDSATYNDYSLLRCLSKEIFGTEQHVDLLLIELISEIQQNLNVYLKDVEDNTKDTYEKIFGRYLGSEKDKHKLVQYAVTRLEDDLPMGDMLLSAACTYFQTKIYVLRFTVSNLSIKSYWKEYLPLRQRADRYGNKESQTEFITLLEAESKRFYRIVAKTSKCNCELTVPKVPSEEQDPVCLLSNAEESFVRQVRRMEALTDIVMDCIDQWLKSNFLLQQTCDKIVQELELRRRNVNIATISGSATGIIGASITAIGIGLAPVTAGVSFALAIAGGVIAATGGTVTLGAKFTETILNKNTLDVLKRYQNNFQELSKTVESKLEEFSSQIEKLDDIANDMKNRQELEALDFSAVQSLPGIFRMAKGLTMIPLAMLRISARGITILGVIIGPLSSLIDFGFMAFSIRNMVKKNKTDISEELRKLSCSLYACRRQIHAWAYGNQKDFIFDLGNQRQKEMN